jgi:TonB family protein
MSSLRGEGGRAGVQMLYLPGISASASATVADPHQERRLALRKPAKRRPPAATPEPAAVAPGAATPGLPGDLLGALYSGVATGHDVHIALPVFAPDPPIVRTKLPDWVRGDVVVEVTIDQTGTVVATRVLQTVGFGLEEIVVATLRQWRFTPAKIDGVSVASRQDIHFHFPS